MTTPSRAPNTSAVISSPESIETEANVAEEIEVSEDLCKEYQVLQQYDTKISVIDEKSEEKLHAQPPDKKEITPNSGRNPNPNQSENIIASSSRETITALSLRQDNHPEGSVPKKSEADLKNKLLPESNIIQSHQSEYDESATGGKIETANLSRQQNIIQGKYNPGAKVVENLEALSKSKTPTDPNLNQHQQSDNGKTSTCKESETHLQQEGCHRDDFPKASVSEQSDAISRSSILINPNLNQSHQDENIKSDTTEETKLSDPLHHQEVQEDLTRDQLTANIQESSESDDRRKVLSDSTSNQNRQGKTIKQPATGESETCTPLQQKEVKRESVADQIKAKTCTPLQQKQVRRESVADQIKASVSQNPGTVPINTGAVRKNTGAVPKRQVVTQALKKSNDGESSKLFTCRKSYAIPSMQRHELRKYTSSRGTEEDLNRPSTSAAAFKAAKSDTASNFSTPLNKYCSAHKSPQKLSERASFKALAMIPETIREDCATHQQSSSSFMPCSENLEVTQNLIVHRVHSRVSEPNMFLESETASSVDHSAGASFSSFRTHVLTEGDRNQTENKQKLTSDKLAPHDSNPSEVYLIYDSSDEELSQAEEDMAAIMDVVEHGDIHSGLVDRLLESGFEVELSQSVEESESSTASEERRLRIQVTQVSKDAVLSDFNQLCISERYDDDDTDS